MSTCPHCGQDEATDHARCADFVPVAVSRPSHAEWSDEPINLRQMPTTVARPWDGPDHPLRDYLALTVPMLMLDMSSRTPRDLYEASRPLVDRITSGADEALYAGASAGLRAADIARAVAILALIAEGGITIMGMHWCIWDRCDWCGRVA